jgi:hypothetical protein
MMRILTMILCASALLAAGCDDSTSPRDVVAPAAPRGLYSVTGDQEVHLSWIENTERDLAGYRIYEAPCASGGGCPYERIGTTASTEFVVRGLANGETRFFAVAAFDRAGNEGPLSYEDVFDTPRPEGFDRVLDNYLDDPTNSAYDFSGERVVAMDHADADVIFGSSNGAHMMFVAFEDTDIQDAGYASSLDAVDWAPDQGWSPSGSVELITGHCYVVWTHDNHFAKFRVTSVNAARVVFDWAYQTDPGNRELKARPVGNGPRVPHALDWSR